MTTGSASPPRSRASSRSSAWRRRTCCARPACRAALFDQEKILVSTEELFALYRGLGQASRDPAIGLKLGTEPRIERYDPIAIAAVSARSFRDALAAAGALQAAHLPGGAAAWWSEGTSAGCSSAGCSRRRRSRRCWSTCASRGWWTSPAGGPAGPSPPKRLELRGATAHREMYEAHFGCPAEFEARENTIVFGTDRPRPALPHPQRGPARDGRPAARGRAGAGARFEGDRRAGQGHPEAAAGRAAARASRTWRESCASAPGPCNGGWPRTARRSSS